MLAAHPGRAYTRRQLLDRVWGADHDGDPRTVDVHVRWLRAKIEADPAHPGPSRHAARASATAWIPRTVNRGLTNRKPAVDGGLPTRGGRQNRATTSPTPGGSSDVTVTTPKRLGALAFAAMSPSARAPAPARSSAPRRRRRDPPPLGAESAAPADLTGTVTIDGSSTVYPITQAVAEDFQKANPGVQVPVAVLRHRRRLQEVLRRRDRHQRRVAADQGRRRGRRRGLRGQRHRVRRAPGRHRRPDGRRQPREHRGPTCLTLDQLKTIYGPDSKEGVTWADLDPAWPAEPIDAYMPGADSGTFDYFTEVVNGEATRRRSGPPSPRTTTPSSTGVAGDKNAIGFFGYAYFVENQDKLKAVEIDGGTGCVAPTEATINDGTYTPLSRPLFIYPDTGKAKTNAALNAFVDYYLANAATIAAEVGYVAVPADVATAEAAEWAAAVPQ